MSWAMIVWKGLQQMRSKIGVQMKHTEWPWGMAKAKLTRQQLEEQCNTASNRRKWSNSDWQLIYQLSNKLTIIWLIVLYRQESGIRRQVILEHWMYILSKFKSKQRVQTVYLISDNTLNWTATELNLHTKICLRIRRNEVRFVTNDACFWQLYYHCTHRPVNYRGLLNMEC